MALRVMWDRFETALLIDTYLKIANGELTRKDAVSQLSNQLRKRAIDKGLNIDDVYRNENGITLQLVQVQRLMEQVPGAEKHNTKIFIEMVDMFYNDKPSFEAILLEAKGGCLPVKTNQEQFMEWLSTRVSPTRLSDYYIAFTDIEVFARKNGIIYGPLYEITDSRITGQILSEVGSAKFYRFMNKKPSRTLTEVAQFYHQYTKENEQKSASATPSVVKQSVPEKTSSSNQAIANGDSNISDTVLPHSNEGTHSNAPMSSKEKLVDFQNNIDLSFTKPISASYFGEVIFESSWRKLYVSICQYLLEDYPHVFEELRNKTISGERPSLIYNEEMAGKLFSPRQISGNFYVEANLNASNIIRNLKSILDACSVDYENVEIHYTSDERVPANNRLEAANAKDPVLAYLEAHGIEYIDLRERLGCLWIIGNQEIKEAIQHLRECGVKLSFLAHGGIATRGRPAWWTKDNTSTVDLKTGDALGNDTTQDLNLDHEKAEDCQEAFIRWMEEHGLSKEICRQYYSAIKALDEYAHRLGYISKSLFEAAHSNEFVTTWNALIRKPRIRTYVNINSERRDLYNSAVKEYAGFLLKRTEVPVRESRLSTAAHKRSNIHPGREEFEEWLAKTGTPSGSAKSYADGVAHIGQFLLEHGLEDRPIFSIRSGSRLEHIRSEISRNKNYVPASSGTSASLELYALKKYISFRRNDSSSGLDEETTERFSMVLQEDFENGYRLGKIIDLNRFKQFYSDRYGTEPGQDNDEIVQVLRQVGIERDDRIFARDNSSNSDIIDDIFADVARVFKQGATCVYYSELYDKYQEELSERLQIYSQEVMKESLLSMSYGEYRSTKYYLYIKDRTPDTDEDIRRVMYRTQEPLNYDAIHHELWYIPMDVIKRCLASTTDYANVAQETYLYVRNLPISSEELSHIAERIHDRLTQKSFLTDVEIREMIEDHFPSVAIDTENFSTWGLRNCLAVLLQDQFSFSGPIISEKGHALNTSQVFMEFSRSHELMTLNDLSSFAKEVSNGVIYWDSVMEVMVRISQDEFVPKDSIEFDVPATDTVLDELFVGEYMAIRDFKLFLHYPPINVKWNTFVLESYAANFSHDFALLHANYTASECCGAIVRRNSTIKEFEDLVMDVLVHSDSWQTKEDALSLLVNMGYLQRKRYSKIEDILPVAKMQREKLLASTR